MNRALVLAVLTVLISQLSVGFGEDGSDRVELEARQYNCPYYMMMNNGTPIAGLSPWLVVCLTAAAALAVSNNYFSLGELFSKNTQRI